MAQKTDLRDVRRRSSLYLLMDPSSILLARAELLSPPGAGNMRMNIVEGRTDDVVAAGVVQAIPPEDDLPLQLGRVIRRRGDLVELEPLRRLGSEVRENLRMPVEFDTFIYPKGGGRVAARSNDLSCGGIAFFTEGTFQKGDVFEIVIPITDGGPLIVNAEVLRERESRDGERMYAAKFTDLINDQEMLIREAVFSIQIQRKGSVANTGK